MENINSFVLSLCACVFAVSIAENLLPDGNVKRAVYFVTALIVLSCFTEPVRELKEQGLDLDNIYDYDEDIIMLNALYSGEIDACFVVGNYISRYKTRSDFEHIADETKVLFTHSEEMETKKSNYLLCSTIVSH